jgi:hypothetical protein
VAFYFQKQLFGGEVSFEPAIVAATSEACPPDERLIKD